MPTELDWVAVVEQLARVVRDEMLSPLTKPEYSA